MEHLAFPAGIRRLVLPALAASVIALAVLAAKADAYVHEYTGHNLPGHTWTTGDGVVVTELDLSHAQANTTSSVCTGPIIYNGSFQAPYGWQCATTDVQWTFPKINAAPAIYNPNSGTFGSYGVIGYGG